MILIFGASGFLGAAIAQVLQNAGLDFRAIVRPNSSLIRIKGIPHERIFPTPVEDWPKLVIKYKPKVVICAFWEGVDANLRRNAEVQMANIQKVLDLAQICIELDVDKFITFGSQAEVSASPELITEEYSANHDSEYASAKSELQGALLRKFHTRPMNLCWVRVFSIYGDGDSQHSLIPQMYQSACQNSIFHVGNPELNWSYLHKKDFQSGLLAVLNSANLFGVINLGNNKPVYVHEIVSVVESELKKMFPEWVGTDLQKKAPSFGKIPETRKLTSVGWKPEVELKDGIRMTVKSLTQSSKLG